MEHVLAEAALPVDQTVILIPTLRLWTSTLWCNRVWTSQKRWHRHIYHICRLLSLLLVSWAHELQAMLYFSNSVVISCFPAALTVLIASLHIVKQAYICFKWFRFVQLRNLAASVRFEVPGEHGGLWGSWYHPWIILPSRPKPMCYPRKTINSEMPGKCQAQCAAQKKRSQIDIATCILQSNELLILVSLLTFTIVITLLERAAYRQPHTHTSTP